MRGLVFLLFVSLLAVGCVGAPGKPTKVAGVEVESLSWFEGCDKTTQVELDKRWAKESGWSEKVTVYVNGDSFSVYPAGLPDRVCPRHLHDVDCGAWVNVWTRYWFAMRDLEACGQSARGSHRSDVVGSDIHRWSRAGARVHPDRRASARHRADWLSCSAGGGSAGAEPWKSPACGRTAVARRQSRGQAQPERGRGNVGSG